MRRPDREITEPSRVWEVLLSGRVVQLAINDPQGPPYVVPLNYAAAHGCIWMHCALEGRKLDLLRADPCVGFCVVTGFEVVTGSRAQDFTSRYASVMGHGRVEEVAGRDEKLKGLAALVAAFADGRADPPPVGPELADTCVVLRLIPRHLTGKRHQGPA
jgi:nitroimidazol reductase NimA-like FMN-containing flavoprotein (pyridoxamine 5'-phosphate oxidase superfamily)